MNIEEIIEKFEIPESQLSKDQEGMLDVFHKLEKPIRKKLGLEYNKDDFDFKLFSVFCVLDGLDFKSNSSGYPVELQMKKGSVICNNKDEFEQELLNIAVSDDFWFSVYDFLGVSREH